MYNFMRSLKKGLTGRAIYLCTIYGINKMVRQAGLLTIGPLHPSRVRSGLVAGAVPVRADRARFMRVALYG